MCRHNLNVVVESLMEFRRGVHLLIHRVELLVLFRNLLQHTFDLLHAGSILHMRREVRDRLSKRKVIHAMGQIGHGSIEVVVHRFGLNVKVSRHAIHHQMSRHLTPRVLRTRVPRVGFHPHMMVRILRILVFPIFVLLFHLKLTFGIPRQRRYRPVHFVIGKDGLAGFVPAQCGEGHDFLIFAELGVDDAVDFAHADGHTEFVYFLAEFFPSGV
mmetsp:Transcript_19985/g.43317  ORF Transcript_19985/g.43317 Transcript_19985/m.43317 type:complete len:214 (-) Transcript_19985:754-1395(-)